MALDAHVMPLWRFKVGDFSSPIEAALGMKPDLIFLANLSNRSLPWHQRFLSKLGLAPSGSAAAKKRARDVAAKDVENLKAEIAELTGTPVHWMDEGCVQYSKQFHEPVVMRAFATWLEHRGDVQEFGKPPEDNYYKHPAWALPKPEQRRFPILEDHCLHTGYLIPVPFEGVHKVEPFMIHNHWKFHHSVASSHSMLSEVTDFLALLSEFETSRHPAEDGIPLKSIRWYATELQTMCALSIEHQLPVIFHG